MAMATYLEAVTEGEIDDLRKDPTQVTQIDKTEGYHTYHAWSINYFLTGNAYPDSAHDPFAAMLAGRESVDCPTLEDGSFGVVAPDEVKLIAECLRDLDLPAIESAIEEAHLADLIDSEELYDLELVDPDDAPVVIVGDIRWLTTFYTRAAKSRLAVVMYAS